MPQPDPSNSFVSNAAATSAEVQDNKLTAPPKKSSTPQRAWQRMLSGRRLDLLNPSPVDIEIEDIAHGLARVARWNGQTRSQHAFSVAQHSVVVEELCRARHPNMTPQDCLYALLHDAPEYVIGDMSSPFKAVLGDTYKDVETRLEEAIHMRFGLPAVIPKKLKKDIKKADLICAYFEAIHLAGFTEAEAKKLFVAPPPDLTVDIEPLTAQKAQDIFLDRFNTLLHDLDRSKK
jgi:5'-deoxynucleotidase YfbR-like HD superfamily hydrolase